MKGGKEKKKRGRKPKLKVKLPSFTPNDATDAERQPVALQSDKNMSVESPGKPNKPSQPQTPPRTPSQLSSGRPSPAGRPRDLARPLEQTIQALHQRLQQSSPIRPASDTQHPLSRAAVAAAEKENEKTFSKKDRLLAGQVPEQALEDLPPSANEGKSKESKRGRKSKRKKPTNDGDATRDDTPSSTDAKKVRRDSNSDVTTQSKRKERKRSIAHDDDVIPERISFDEGDIYSVLEQVESGAPAAVSDAKKSKMADDDAMTSNFQVSEDHKQVDASVTSEQLAAVAKHEKKKKRKDKHKRRDDDVRSTKASENIIRPASIVDASQEGSLLISEDVIAPENSDVIKESSSKNDDTFKTPPPPAERGTTLKGNPTRPPEVASGSRHHLMSRIPKKRIDAYQYEYEQATSKSNESSDAQSVTSSHAKTNLEKEEVPVTRNKKVDNWFSSSSLTSGNDERSSEAFKDVLNDTITSLAPPPAAPQARKITEDDFFPPPSPLPSARHSNIGQLAQVSRMRTQSVVMPASPRPPPSNLTTSRSTSSREKEHDKSKLAYPPQEATFADAEVAKDDAIVNAPAPQPPYTTGEPDFNPPSILPPDNNHFDNDVAIEEHTHSATPPPQTQPVAKPVYSNSNNTQSSVQAMYPPTCLDSAPNVDMPNQTGSFNQQQSQTCAVQKQQTSAYDSFSPPYAGSSAGPSPSVAHANTGGGSILSPMSNSGNTPTYTPSQTSNAHYSNFYPGTSAPSNLGMQYGMESSQRESVRQQNRTPVMGASERGSSPHSGGLSKPYGSNYAQAEASAARISSRRDKEQGRSHSASSRGSSATQQQQQQQRSSVGRSPSSDARNTTGSYYNQTNYASANHSQQQSMTSPPNHPHRSSLGDQRSSGQRSSFESSYPSQGSYGGVGTYGSYESGSSSQHQQQQQSTSHKTHHQTAGASHAHGTSSKGASSKHTSPQQHASSHRAASSSTSSSAHAQNVKNSRTSSHAASSSKTVKKTAAHSGGTKSHYDTAMEQNMMSLYDRGMTPYLHPFSNLSSPSSRNYTHDPYLMYQRSASVAPHKSDPFGMLHNASRSQNSFGFNWSSHAHAQHHTPASQSSFANFPNFFSDMNSASAAAAQDFNALKLASEQHNSLQQQWSNRNQMNPLHHMSSFFNHQHGFDSRAVSGSMAGPFAGHGAAFGMPFLPGDPH